MDEEELPPWIVKQSTNPVLNKVIAEMLKNARLAAEAEGAFGGTEERPPFPVYLGDRKALDVLNKQRPKAMQAQPSKQMGGATVWGAQPDSSATSAGVYIDVDRLHKMAPDSAQAETMVRDALLHEFGHVLPVAKSRHMRDVTGDPPTTGGDVSGYPVMQNENRLRGLFDLPAKKFYGVQEGK